MISTRQAMLSQTLDDEGAITIKDYEDLVIKVRRLQRENRRLKKLLEEYELYSDDNIA